MDQEDLLHKFILLEQALYLLPQKAIYWKEKEILIISDLHLGKASHFRKAGIPIPLQIHQADYLRLEQLVTSYSPKEIIFLGDLFHSSWNTEWQYFHDWCNKNEQIKLHLVEGNHDILPKNLYNDCNLFVHQQTLTIPPFIFSHEPIENFSPKEILYNISGHLHPSVRLSGVGNQNLTFPCYYFKPKQGILPAFGNFTGCTRLSATKEDKVFIVTNERVILV